MDYSTIRKDWNNIILGSGLLLFTCNNVVFDEKLHFLEQTGMEILSIRFRTSTSLWMEVYKSTFPSPQLSRPTLILTSSIHLVIP